MKRFLSSIMFVCLISVPALAKDFHWPSLKKDQKFPSTGVWIEIKKKFQDEQKAQEALELIKKHLVESSIKNDPVDWTRSLVWKSNFQTALGQAETGLEELKSAEWPKAAAAQFVLNLYLVVSLENYLNTYSWEIRQREKVATSAKLNLKSLTHDQIVAEIRKIYAALWKDRESLGGVTIESLSEFISQNGYPKGLRGTLRDFLTYSLVQFETRSDLWTPEELSQKDYFETKQLLDLPTVTANGDLLSETRHPLLVALSALGDLRQWNQKRGEQAGVLQTYIESYKLVFANLSSDSAKEELLKAFEERVEKFRKIGWYSWGIYQLATLVQGMSAPDALVKARALAKKGAEAYPAETGGRNCQQMIVTIESPGFRMEEREADGAAYRSMRLDHKNIKQIYLRYYAYSMDEFLNHPQSFSFNYANNSPEIRKRLDTFLADHKMVKEFTVPLPDTPDYREHKTYFVANGLPEGSYIVLASAEPNFSTHDNLLYSAHFIQSDLFFGYTYGTDGTQEFRVYRGVTGEGVSGATVELWHADYSSREMRYTITKTYHTDGEGKASAGNASDSHIAIIKKGNEITRSQNFWTGNYGNTPEEKLKGMVFTDRGAYRPKQKILWKVLLFNSGKSYTDFRVARRAEFSLDLVDMNGQVIATQSGSGNEFGTASGSFDIPQGRALGQWSLTLHAKNDKRTYLASKYMKVEEYKRPTFFVELPKPKENLRLNTKAKFEGEAKYYFGAPVTDAKVKWRVTRNPRLPYWWGWWGEFCGRFSFWQEVSRPLVVASGETKVKDGKFIIEFTPAARETKESIDNEVGFDFQLEADVTETSGETRSASLHQDLYFTDRRVRFENLELQYIDAKDIALDLDLETVAGQGVAGEGTLKVSRLQDASDPLMPSEEKAVPNHLRRYFDGFKTEGDFQRDRVNSGSYMNLPQSLALLDEKGEVQSYNLNHDGKGHAHVVVKNLTPGAYRALYQTKDTRGHIVKSVKEFVLLSRKVSTPLALVVVAPEKPFYVGQTAQLFIDSGFKNAHIYVEIKKGKKAKRHKFFDLAREGRVIDIPIKDEDRGGISYRVTLVRKHEILSTTGQIQVPYENRDLTLSWERFRDTLRPKTKETWTLKVEEKNSSGKPVSLKKQVEALVSAYDQSLDVFQANAFSTPNSFFPGEPGLSWVTSFVRQSPVESVHGYETGPYYRAPAYQGFKEDEIRNLNPYAYGGLGYRGGMMRHARGGYASGMAEEDAVSSMGSLQAANAPALRQANMLSKAVAKKELSDKDAGETTSNEKQKGQAIAPPPAPEAPKEQGDSLRSDFRETAFWLPHLLSGKDGQVSVEFEVPDSVTTWSVLAMAHGKDLSSGVLSKIAKSAKDLLVRPNMPRFLREGDEARLSVVLNNTAKETLSGFLTFEITEGAEQRSVHELFGLASRTTQLPFSIQAGKSQTLNVTLKAPKIVGLYDVTVKAASKNFSDGERRPLMVLPSREHLFQSRFVALKGAVQKTVKFEDMAKAAVDGSKTTEKMVVTVDGQLFYQALKALPYLWQYPYECVEQTLNRFLPTAMMAKLYESDSGLRSFAKASSKRKSQWDTFDQMDPNRKVLLEETPFLWAAKGGLNQEDTTQLVNMLDPSVVDAQKSESLALLKKAQNGDGGFPWWPGGPSEEYMTLYLVAGFAKALEFGVEVPKDMLLKAWQYLAHQWDTRGWPAVEASPEYYVWLAYVFTAYPDASYHGNAIDESKLKRITEIALEHWKSFSPYTKAYLTLFLKRRGMMDKAKLVFNSVMDSAKTSEDLGTYWAPEDRSWLWYRDTIETHAWALRTLAELDPKDSRAEGMVQWIFLNKKLNQWKSTRATAETLYALAYYMKTHALLGVPESVTAEAGPQKRVFDFTAKAGAEFKQQWLLSDKEVDPKTMSEIKFSKTTPGINFASATWHFASDELQKESSGDFMSVQRSYFKRVLKGKEFVLEPLTEGSPVKVGDEVEVHLSIRSKHEAEYVQLRDPRAAGFEPVSFNSGYKWDLGIYWYEEIRDQATNFFFSRLPVGEYGFKYRVRATMAGHFRVSSATLQSMYAPEFGGYSAGNRLTIEP